MQQAFGFETIELKPEERTPCEVWTRVMGYHRPVSAFNAGKQSEHRERLYFREEKAQRFIWCAEGAPEEAHV